MPHYLIAQVKVAEDGWIAEYAAKVPDMIHRHGGKYLSRSANITPVEGEQPDLDLVAIVEFPDMDSLQAFVADPDYEPFRAARQSGAHSQLFAIDDTDAAGAIDYLAPEA